MNEPRKPDAQWIAEVRARNREQLGLAGLGQNKVESWKPILILSVVGFLFWKLST